MSGIGYLITNLGTPASPAVEDVRAYLEEFLMDPYVVDLPWPVRRLLVSAIILPFRPKRSAHAYAAIWTEQGSPLLVYSRILQQALHDRLRAPVALAMRYGEPSLAAGLQQLRTEGVTQVVVVPLYPQYADSTITTTIDAVGKVLPADMHASFITGLYAEPEYIAAQAASIRQHLPEQWDHLLLSYHGLPERQLKKADPTGKHCMQHPDCCNVDSKAHGTCYRHQVFATSSALAGALGLNPDQYSISFQSRLGRGWLQPYTDEVLAELPATGVKHLAVACPAFVADNLETLEEISLQGRETFLQAGGESFAVIPCLNGESAWVEALANIIERHQFGGQTVSATADTSR